MVRWDHTGRIGRVRKGLAKDRLDAMVFTDLANMYYLSGFRGSDGALFVSEDGVALLVDGRYGTQAAEQAPQAAVTVYPQKVSGIAEKIKTSGVRRVGFEGKSVPFDLYQALRAELPDVTFAAPSEWYLSLRTLKDEDEIALLKKANRIADEALLEVLKIIKAGIAEREIAVELEYRMKKKGAEGASFPILVAAGERAALPHAAPTGRTLKNGELCFIDFGCTLDGYQTDQTVTVALGKPKGRAAELYAIVKEAHDRAIAAAVSGAALSDVDAAARDYIADKGYGKNFSHSLGHGIGIEVHEYPTLSAKSRAKLEPGMVFTIEPGIYIPGEGGVRIEDAMVLGKGGVELLTSVDKELLHL